MHKFLLLIITFGFCISSNSMENPKVCKPDYKEIEIYTLCEGKNSTVTAQRTIATGEILCQKTTSVFINGLICAIGENLPKSKFYELKSIYEEQNTITDKKKDN